MSRRRKANSRRPRVQPCTPVVRGVRDEVLVYQHPTYGKVMAVLPVIPDHAPDLIREGIARRRIATLTGTCPCGATIDYGQPRPGQVGVVEALHEDGCPAVTELLVAAIRRWSA